MKPSLQNPFKVKGIAREEGFFNRFKEIDTLFRNAVGGQHTLLTAPRRFGKSSLLEKVGQRFEKESDGIVARIDLFKCSTTEEFLWSICHEIIRIQRGPVLKLLALFRKGLPKLSPKISINPMGEAELSINAQASTISLNDLEELLLWFDSRGKKNKNLIIFDEIQELSSYDKSGKVERYLRSIVQNFKNTTVFYSGSLPTLLQEMFFNRKRPFYQSAIKMELGFTPLDETIRFINSNFKKSGEPLSKTLSDQISTISNGHPYYVQLLGYYAWELFLKTGTWENIQIEEVLASVFTQERTNFEQAISLLTHQQRNVFRAIAKNPNCQITSRDFLKEHNLPAHSSVLSAVKRLEALGFVLKNDAGFAPSDPILAKWWEEVS